MNLINLLKIDNARKIFGKKEIKIIEKQLSGIDLTQSEKNRLSRDIRPKFEFIKEVSRFSDDFKIEKNKTNKELIKIAVKTIFDDCLNKDIKAIFLFGSFADNTFTKRSDIDICVLFKNNISLKDATSFRIRVSGQLNNRLDIQVFNILPQKLKRSIANNHKLLYKSEDYDNISFSINHLKDDDYFIRMKKIFGVEI